MEKGYFPLSVKQHNLKKAVKGALREFKRFHGVPLFYLLFLFHLQCALYRFHALDLPDL